MRSTWTRSLGGSATPLLAPPSLPERETETAPKPEVASENPDGSGEPISKRRIWLMLALFLVIVVIIIVRMAYWAMASPTSSIYSLRCRVDPEPHCGSERLAARH